MIGGEDQQMRVGMTLPWSTVDGDPLRGRGIADSAALLEATGFESLWVFDAIGRGFAVPDPLISLAVAATATTKVELGTCILQLGIRHPVDVAHRLMTTQLIVGDRLSIGVGAGSTEDDFIAFDADYEGRFAAFPRNLDRLLAVLAGRDPLGVDLTPWDEVKGGPRILIGSWGGTTWIPRAAKEFDGWIASAAKGGRLAEGVERYKSEGGDRAIVTNIHVDLDADQATADRFPFSLQCSEAQAKDRLAWLEEIGFTDVVLRTSTHTPRNLERIRGLW